MPGRQRSHCAIPAWAQQSKDQWSEEILLQLPELRKSQGELAKQIAGLKTEVQAAPAAEPAKAVSMDLRDSKFPVLGDSSAAVAIGEFSDFECPYCRRHQKNTVQAAAGACRSDQMVQCQLALCRVSRDLSLADKLLLGGFNRFLLILGGIKVQGKIVGYEEKLFRRSA